MITWIKPSGNEVETSESKASIEAAKSLGWERKSTEKPAPKKAATKKADKKV